MKSPCSLMNLKKNISLAVNGVVIRAGVICKVLSVPFVRDGDFKRSTLKIWNQDQYLEAWNFVSDIHNGQTLPGSDIPYIKPSGWLQWRRQQLLRMQISKIQICLFYVHCCMIPLKILQLHTRTLTTNLATNHGVCIALLFFTSDV